MTANADGVRILGKKKHKHKTRSRKDHYLPQGYMRGFIGPNPTNPQKPLWHLSLSSREWKEMSTSEIAFEEGFYDRRREDATLTTADQAFAEFERTFPLIRQELISANFSNWRSHLNFLLRYLEMMRLRTPLAFEQRIARDKKQSWGRVVSVGEKKVTYEPATPSDEWFWDKAISDMLAELPKRAEWLNSFQWCLRYCVSADDPFILPDTPCIVEGRFTELEVAMTKPETLVVFPLCWQACLLGSIAPFEVDTAEFAHRDLRIMRYKHATCAKEFVVSPVRLDGIFDHVSNL
jgi:Protein of unknown function (DUF4238)